MPSLLCFSCVTCGKWSRHNRDGRNNIAPTVVSSLRKSNNSGYLKQRQLYKEKRLPVSDKQFFSVLTSVCIVEMRCYFVKTTSVVRVLAQDFLQASLFVPGRELDTEQHALWLRDVNTEGKV